MASNPPSKEFGKRRPRMPADLPLPPREPVKRSGHVALLVMGTIAVGSSAFMLMPQRNCDPTPPGATVPGATTPAPVTTNCSSSSSSSGSHWSSRSGFYSSDSSSHSSSGGSSDAGSGGVTRGGFGSFAHAFSGGG
ncbi:hypothetical protein G8O24_17250 [Bradyrhizobium sp. INPA01-394B]|uniref:Uncharacterized protein n=1 Tax=Bradyrhizobium campsiandrae TaxID=1729892 RepID=A0ABR7UGG2_9BRAD|nr:hypothetical protein [Bradyrhizobium campsiandrae]MBC9879089.1 hypothetical protein [Bradyrhizobium campsiandrae]MBC9982972.1 hypothetical protein [Bradyrhizobium campsiandrae]